MSNFDQPSDMASSRECPAALVPVLEKIEPHTADVGGIVVRRVLPRRQRRLIGAWCFLDHIGPVIRDAVELHVGAHPHIGLQTFTWMMEGEIIHRDSLGTEQVIRPGQVNLMTAGRGIAHTEDSVPGHNKIHAAQLWIALPPEHADTTPRFDHFAELPCWAEGPVQLTLLLGEFGSRVNPAPIFSPLVGIDLVASEAGGLELPLQQNFEYGLLPLSGDFIIENELFAPNQLAYLGCGRNTVKIKHPAQGRALLIGGAPMSEEVLIWWNFVSHNRADIIQAQQDWETHSARFAEVPGSDGRRLRAPPIPWAK